VKTLSIKRQILPGSTTNGKVAVRRKSKGTRKNISFGLTQIFQSRTSVKTGSGNARGIRELYG